MYLWSTFLPTLSTIFTGCILGLCVLEKCDYVLDFSQTPFAHIFLVSVQLAFSGLPFFFSSVSGRKKKKVDKQTTRSNKVEGLQTLFVILSHFEMSAQLLIFALCCILFVLWNCNVWFKVITLAKVFDM